MNKTIGDVVMEHVDMQHGGTCDGVDLLELPHNASSNYAANTYLAALGIIKKLRAYLDQKYGSVILLAEVCESLENTKVYFGSGDECHLVYNFPLHGQLLLALKDGVKELPAEFISRMDGIGGRASVSSTVPRGNRATD